MKRILIIEDDPIITHIYRTHLENETYTVEACSDGQTGFERLEEINPDAILLDLMLPRMNGIDFLKKVRAQSKFASIPIVVFTNAYLPNMIQEAVSAGASHVYSKASLTPRQLLDCLYFLVHGKNRVWEPTVAGALSPESLSGTTLTPVTPTNPALAPWNDHPGSPPPPANYGYNNDYRSTPATPQHAAARSEEPPFGSELYDAFVAGRAETLAGLRAYLTEFMNPADEASRERHLVELYRQVHALGTRASLAKFVDIAQICSALEVLLKDLHEHPKHITPSTLRTVTQCVDFLAELLNASEPRFGETPSPKILVVDDEILSRRAIVHALEKGGLRAVDLEDPVVALRMTTEEEFDLILLDIQMPELNGFELCTRIRALPTNKNTPILFITSLTDFKSRARSTLSGGTDLIAKPFLFIEVTVKAIMLVLRKRLFTQTGAGLQSKAA
jgi:CheY-like chemotaxis protein